MIKVLVVGSTPPPFGGQAIMIEKLLQCKFSRVKLYHVRMAFSQDMAEMGRFRIGKVLHLMTVILRIIWVRFVYGVKILYYPPGGPERIPMFRDIAILITTRWLFSRTIFHFHSGGISELIERLSPLEKLLAHLAYYRPDCAIRLSEFNPEDGERLKARRNLVIPNGLDDQYLCYGGDSNIINPVPTILFVGVLRPSKGVKVLLEACRELRVCGVQFHLEVMGQFYSSEFKAEVEALIESFDLASHVTFLDVKIGDEKWQAYARADLFCFPSFFEAETFGLVLIEAMQFCLPIVATRWRGIPSVVRDGETGYLVPVRDANAVTERLGLLLKDVDKRRAMGKRGREIYLKEFSLEQWYSRMEDVFVKTADLG